MEKDNSIQFPVDSIVEHSATEAPVLPFIPTPRPPLTPDEIAAGEELCKMMGIDLNSIPEEVYQKLRKIWE